MVDIIVKERINIIIKNFAKNSVVILLLDRKNNETIASKATTSTIV
jgi:hypothetical protein